MTARIFEESLYPYRLNPDQKAGRPAHHKVVVVGAGPVGLSAALDLALRGIPVVVLDENEKVSWGSRAICFAQRTLQILDRLGLGDTCIERGITWQRGKVFFDTREVFAFDLQPEAGHRRPAFINLQQYHLEKFLVERLRAIESEGVPIELRGRNKVIDANRYEDHVELIVDTPDGPYTLHSDWVIACDGANSPMRSLLGLDFRGRIFEDNFLIADVIMKADFPTERWFWFDPPFNRGQSALLHKQPDDVWRIDLQLGWDIDRDIEIQPERVRRRLEAMLGPQVDFEFEWISIYTFQCRRMERFRHGRVIFAGDSAHQVSPFGARGANSGVQDIDNLGWKLAAVVEGKAPEMLIDSYDLERIAATDANILASTRSTDFITPKSETSRLFRDAVLDLSEKVPFARPLVNSGRLSQPAVYDGSPLNGPNDRTLPQPTRPGAPAPDAPLENGWLLGQLGNGFTLLGVNADPPEVTVPGFPVERLRVDVREDTTGALKARYLGSAPAALYLLRPDQHVAARWSLTDEGEGSRIDPTSIAGTIHRATASR